MNASRKRTIQTIPLLLLLGGCNDIFGLTPYYRADCKSPGDSCGDGGAGGSGVSSSASGQGGGIPMQCPAGQTPTVELCSTAADENCDGYGYCVGEPVSAIDINGDVNLLIGEPRIAVDSAGNIILTGAFEGIMKFGADTLTSAGSGDIYVAKLDKQMKPVWSQKFGDASKQSAIGVATDALNNIIITGSYAGTIGFGGTSITSASNQDDIFLLKFAPDGTHLWSKSFGDGNAQFSAGVATDAANNLVIAGTNYANQAVVDFGCGPTTNAISSDVLLAKLDPNGNCIWSTNISSSNQQSAKDVTVDGSGNVFVAGDYNQPFVIFGQTLPAQGASDFFVSMFDSNGTHIWSKGFAGTGTENAVSLAADFGGNAIVTGNFSSAITLGNKTYNTNGNADVFLFKLDALGTMVWSRALAGSGYASAGDVAIDSDNNVIVVATPFLDLDFGSGPIKCGTNDDIAAAKYDANGSLIWNKCWGDNKEQHASGVAANAFGNLFMTGYFIGSLGMGGLQAADSDIFIAALTP